MSCFEVFHCKKTEPKARNAKKKAGKSKWATKKVGVAASEEKEEKVRFIFTIIIFISWMSILISGSFINVDFISAPRGKMQPPLHSQKVKKYKCKRYQKIKILL